MLRSWEAAYLIPGDFKYLIRRKMLQKLLFMHLRLVKALEFWGCKAHQHSVNHHGWFLSWQGQLLRKQSDSSPSLILNNIGCVHPLCWEVREESLVFHQALWPAPEPSQTLFFSLSSPFNHTVHRILVCICILDQQRTKLSEEQRKSLPQAKHYTRGTEAQTDFPQG